jgi:hypothetical protein
MAKNKNSERQGPAKRPEQVLGIDRPDLDPEGWMAERPDYWMDLDPPALTRGAWLRHRVAEAAACLGLHLPESSRAPVSEEEWIRLSEMALGPLPRPKRARPKAKARPTEPDARKPARKPEASSPAPAAEPRAPAAR